MNFTTKSTTLVRDCEVLGFSFQIQAQLPSRKYKVSQIMLIIVNSVIMISTLITNSLIIITFWKSSQLRKKVSFLFIAAQSIADLVFGFIASRLFISALLDGMAPPYNCTLRFVTMQIISALMPFTLFTLTGLNLERYFGIVHPILHRTKSTTKLFWKYMLFSCTCTVISFSLSLVQTIQWNRYSYPVTMLAFLAVSIYVYCKIFVAGLSRRVHGETSAQNTQQVVGDSRSTTAKRFAQELKLAKSCFIVVIFFLFTILPVAIVRILATNGNLNSFDFITWRNWTGTLFLTNSSLNSYIFFWRNRLLRIEAAKVLKGK